MHKVLVCDKLSKEGLSLIESSPNIKVDVKIGLSEEELCKIVPEYDAIIVRSATKITKNVLSSAQKLKLVARAGVGVDNVDVIEATKRGIVVMNVPGANTIAAAEHTMALILSLVRHIPSAHQSMREGKWERTRFMGTQLFGKVLGIIGLGRIGQEVAKRASAFGMKVVAYDPYVLEKTAKALGVKMLSLSELLSISDIITIHTPLSDETKGIISEKELKMCKDGVFIINCARGGIVDESALYKAYKEGKVAGFALDVYEKEPPEKPLFLDVERCVLTPHLGASTQEAQEVVSVEIAKQVIEALEYGNYLNAVNIPYIKPEEKEFLTPYCQLAESMGSLHAQLAKGAIEDVHLAYMGQLSGYETACLTSAFLKGLLSHMHKEFINYVNAPFIAEESGIKIKETKQKECKDFQNLLSTTVSSQGRQRNIDGTVFGKDDIRIVYIDGFRIDAVPAEHLLILSQTDEPGIIGKVGTILGEGGINIGWLQLARKGKGEDALSVWNVDAPVPSSLLEKIRQIKEVLDAHYVVI